MDAFLLDFVKVAERCNSLTHASAELRKVGYWYMTPELVLAHCRALTWLGVSVRTPPRSLVRRRRTADFIRRLRAEYRRSIGPVVVGGGSDGRFYVVKERKYAIRLPMTADSPREPCVVETESPLTFVLPSKDVRIVCD